VGENTENAPPNWTGRFRWGSCGVPHGTNGVGSSNRLGEPNKMSVASIPMRGPHSGRCEAELLRRGFRRSRTPAPDTVRATQHPCTIASGVKLSSVSAMAQLGFEDVCASRSFAGWLRAERAGYRGDNDSESPRVTAGTSTVPASVAGSASRWTFWKPTSFLRRKIEVAGKLFLIQTSWGSENRVLLW